MKREREPEHFTYIPSLKTRALYTIVSEFKTEQSFRLYMGNISNQTARQLLEEAWIQKQSPAHIMFHESRRLLKAELKIEYTDMQECKNGEGVMSQTTRTKNIPIQIDVASTKIILIEQSLSHLQAQLSLSDRHRKPRFLLSFEK